MDKLWAHQEIGIRAALAQDNFAFFWDMGVGKTRAAIDVIRHRCHQNKRLMKVLILGPRAVSENWRREFLLFSKIDNRDILVLDQSGAKRAEKFKKFVQDPTTLAFSKPRVIISNYEMAQMKELVAAIKEWSPEILVCDESHRLKSHESKRAKIIIDIADRAKHKLLLTGTPILQSAMDVFNQMRVLDSGATFGNNFYAFRSQYFEDENAGWASKANHFPKWRPRPSTYKKFNELLYKKGSRVIKSECMSLPPFVREVAEVELSNEQRRLYDDMKAQFIAYIETEEKNGTPRAVVAQLAITKSLRLLQILTGFAKAEDGYIHEIKENPRLGVLSDYLEQLHGAHKVIVWCIFHENYKAIAKVCEKLKIGYAEYHGLTPNGEREDNLERFRKDPDCRVLISNPKAGGVGINLTEASYSIFYSRSFSLEADLQAEARNFRGGSEVHQKITRIDLVAPKTIDEIISEVLANKLDAAETILNMRNKL